MPGTISGITEFSVGTVVYLEYTAPTSPGRVALNFTAPNGDIILHVNPRYDQKNIVLNSQLDGRWGPEERPTGFPITPGVKTCITVTATDTAFVICANGSQIGSGYKYRKPLTEITAVSTSEGDITIGKKIPDCQPGRGVFVEVRTPPSERFALNMYNLDEKQLSSTSPKDIAFHFNPRFNEPTGVVVRNSFIRQGWGREERDGGMPIRPSEDCTIVIIYQRDCFQVLVNGVPFVKYTYRVPTASTMILLAGELSTVKRMQII